MKNQIHNYDFLIVGAGLVGSLLALSLIKKKFKVKIIEKHHQILKDQRTLAINANSKDFLNQIGIWNKIKTQPEVINRIIIQDHLDNNQKLVFENREEPMGHVAYNYEIQEIVRSKLLKLKCMIGGINLNQDNIKANEIIVLNKSRYLFKKIIFATGKNANFSKGFSKKTFPTKHKSYVGFFSHSKNHQNIAYEIFTKNGPLAVLPAPSKKKNYSTFIFSTPEPYSIPEQFKILKKNFQGSHGAIKLKKKIFEFSLNPHLTKTKLENIILLGDSLRSMHPVAGQGWNLGIKDIQTFCDLTDLYDFRSNYFDEIYYAKRQLESVAYLGMTSMINYVYDHPNFFNHFIIRTSFKALQKFKPLRNLFIKQAMGRGYTFV